MSSNWLYNSSSSPALEHHHLPHVPEDYVHRIGRTGRAGRSGAAVSLVCADEAPQLRGIQRLLGHPILSTVVEGFAPSGHHAPSVVVMPRRRPRQRPGRQAAS